MIRFKGIVVTSVLLSGCSVGTLQLNLDDSLANNSTVHSVKKEGGLSGNGQNLSFGPYSTKGNGWIKTSTTTTTDIFSLGNIFNLDDSDATKKRMKRSHKYDFTVAGGDIWNAECVLVSREREQKIKDLVAVETLSSDYACQFTTPGQSAWVLTVLRDKNFQVEVEFTNQARLFKARLATSDYVKSNGQTSFIQTPKDAGYVWRQEQNALAAVGVRLKEPKIWLSNANSQEDKNLLSMASAGLLVYHWRILTDLNY